MCFLIPKWIVLKGAPFNIPLYVLNKFQIYIPFFNAGAQIYAWSWKSRFYTETCIACSIKKMMNGFFGNAKYTRTFVRQYQDHVNKSWWMTFLVTQNTRGLYPFPSRRSKKKCVQKPSTYQINALGEFHFPEKIARVLFLGNLVRSKVLRYGTEKSLIYTRTFHLPAQFSASFLAKCLRVNRALLYESFFFYKDEIIFEIQVNPRGGISILDLIRDVVRMWLCRCVVWNIYHAVIYPLSKFPRSICYLG